MIVADLFCGAGGTSTGMVLAAKKRGIEIELIAINHWQRAVETHQHNHPWARHVCADLGSVEADPSRLVPGGKLDLLIASPECTHHSIARGGKPCENQSRASTWHVLHWCERLRVEELLIENVKEFESWGPLTKANHPDKKHKGATFRSFVGVLMAMGYNVEWRIMNAADYGDATTRKRLFLRASRKPIKWPEPTHIGKWRAAREIIDWSLKGKNIATRKRPLKERTLQRIEAGLKKFGGEAFLVILRGTAQKQKESWSKSVNGPVPTISAGGIHAGLCEPFIMNVAHEGSNNSRVRSVDVPLCTIPAGHRGELALCEPFVIPMEHGGRAAIRTVENPLPTITTAKGGAFGMCQPFLTKYYGTAKSARPVDEPLDTISTKDRFGLVETFGMEIRFRMLQPSELAAAMGFDGYSFFGTKTEQVRQIGNAVCVHIAESLCGTIIDSFKNKKRQI